MKEFMAKTAAVVDRFNKVMADIPLNVALDSPEFLAWSAANNQAFRDMAELGKEAKLLIAQADAQADADANHKQAAEAAGRVGPMVITDDGESVLLCSECGSAVRSGVSYRDGSFLCYPCDGGIPEVEPVDFHGRERTAHSS